MPGQPFDRIAVLYNYLFHNTSKGHTVAVADILTNYRNHGYELEIKSFYRDKGLEPDRPQYQRRSEPPVVRRRPYPQYE